MIDYSTLLSSFQQKIVSICNNIDAFSASVPTGYKPVYTSEVSIPTTKSSMKLRYTLNTASNPALVVVAQTSLIADLDAFLVYQNWSTTEGDNSQINREANMQKTITLYNLLLSYMAARVVYIQGSMRGMLTSSSSTTSSLYWLPTTKLAYFYIDSSIPPTSIESLDFLPKDATMTDEEVENAFANMMASVVDGLTTKIVQYDIAYNV